MNRNRVARLDGIVTEILSTLDDFGIHKITEVINSGYIPWDITKFIFVPLSKTRCACAFNKPHNQTNDA